MRLEAAFCCCVSVPSNLLSVFSDSKTTAKFFNAHSGLGQMNDCVTVGAHGDQITNWVKLVFATNLREWDYVMHVNESLANSSICSFKVEIASGTLGPMVFDTN